MIDDNQKTFNDVLEADWDTESEGDRGDQDSAARESSAERSDDRFWHLAPDARPYQRLSCPWCCNAQENLVEHEDGHISCPHCSSRIPKDAEWYQDGDKIGY